MINEPQTAVHSQRRKISNPPAKKALKPVLAILLIAALFYGGYRYIDYQFTVIQQATEQQINSTLVEIQEANALHISIINETLASILGQMEQLKLAIGEAGIAAGSSTTFQENLHRQLIELEQQLAELQVAIELLQQR